MLHCRSCLDSEAPPSLTAAAAALAGGFVEAGLAGSDPALLTRLMAQLIALLKAKASKRQQLLYSEWVPLQAYLALLQAHAQFATAGESVLDADSRQVVQSAQEPHRRCAFWLAVPAHFPQKDIQQHAWKWHKQYHLPVAFIQHCRDSTTPMASAGEVRAH